MKETPDEGQSGDPREGNAQQDPPLMEGRAFESWTLASQVQASCREISVLWGVQR